MVRIIFLSISVLIFSFPAFSQTPAYPKGYFRWPVNLTPDIVANLGELRPNHWHMGLDVRTNGKVNQQVFAAADGYIAHVGIRASSFGRFIIINHPNGLSTLYAHLNDFAPALEKYVTDQQYKQESWAIELDIPKELFPVSKGSFISWSGTTGGSQGPHVHFEIRDTKTGDCLNPLLFGFPLQDQVPPTLMKLAIYDRMGSSYDHAPRLLSLRKTDSGYVIPSMPVIKTDIPKISFGIQAIDHRNGTNNQDGVYSAALSLDNINVISFVLDSINYSETLYMNAHVDYPLSDRGGPWIQLLSALPGERSTVYHPGSGLGVIDLEDTDPHAVQITVKDAAQNISVIKFAIQYSGAEYPATTRSGIRLSPAIEQEFTKPDFEVVLPPGSLYDTVSAYYSRSSSVGGNAITALHQFGDPVYPVHDNLIVSLKTERQIEPALREKLVIQRNGGGRNSKKAKWEDDWVTADFGDFGSFQGFLDITPPTINNLGSPDTINISGSRIAFTPNDNFGIKSFRAELDGQWLRFTNDKSRVWIYNFDQRCPYGLHSLKVTVEDLVGNQTVKEWWFKRTAYTAPPPRKKSGGKKSGKARTTASKKKSVKKKK